MLLLLKYIWINEVSRNREKKKRLRKKTISKSPTDFCTTESTHIIVMCDSSCRWCLWKFVDELISLCLSFFYPLAESFNWNRNWKNSDIIGHYPYLYRFFSCVFCEWKGQRERERVNNIQIFRCSTGSQHLFRVIPYFWSFHSRFSLPSLDFFTIRLICVTRTTHVTFECVKKNQPLVFVLFSNVILVIWFEIPVLLRLSAMVVLSPSFSNMNRMCVCVFQQFYHFYILRNKPKKISSKIEWTKWNWTIKIDCVRVKKKLDFYPW